MGRRTNKENSNLRRKASWSKWWDKNGPAVLQKRKDRYLADEEYRDRAKKYSKVAWASGEFRRSNDRLKKIRIAKRKMKEEFDSGKIRRLNPRIIKIDGVNTTVYPMLHLAVALGAEKHSVKRWTQIGVLPKPTHVDNKNRYWYTQEYISTLESVYEGVRSQHWALDDFREVLKKKLCDFDWD